MEGITEFLPISSTAHLILTSKLLGIRQYPFTEVFIIAIQSGAILSVIVVYWRKLINFEIQKKIIAAFIPTAIIGFLLYNLITKYFWEGIGIMLVALYCGGWILIYFEKFFVNSRDNLSIEELNYKKAFIIGLAQSIAIIPGVSRSAATIISGRLLGLGRDDVVEFSFLLAVPTIMAATMFDIIKNINIFTVEHISILGIGFVTAFISALLSIRFFLSYINTHSFRVFGIYRIALAFVCLALLAYF